MTQVSALPVRVTDGAALLTVYVVLLLGVPASMVVAPLGTAGGPSTMLAMVSLVLWLWFQIQRDNTMFVGSQPVRRAMTAWLIIMLIVYAHAMSQPLPGDELSPADSGLLRLLGVTGLVLFANDGILSSEHHRALARRLVIAVGVVALLGIFQTATKQLWIDRISIPGLTSASANLALAARSGLTRPSGTSTHPIEFGMVLTMALPLAITFARSAPGRRWIYQVMLLAISVATVLSISRSAMICASVAVIVTIFSWPLASKLRALAFMAVVGALVFLTVPGMLGTIVNLFAGIDNDSSVASRTGSYGIAGMFIERSPLLGRGFGTFLPKYWILDNGYLGLLIEGGFVGLGGLLLVIVVAIVTAHRTARIQQDPFDRDLARALAASVAAGAAGLAFFDTFAFPQSAGIFFLLIGMSGAAWRLANEARSDARTQADQPSAPPLPSGVHA